MQNLLRNAPSPFGASWRQLQLGWFWRSRVRRGLYRPLPISVLALIHVVAFAAAGIFSSRISRKSVDVLVRSPICGYFNSPPAQMNASKIINAEAPLLRNAFSYLNYVRRSATQSFNYVQACNGHPDKLRSMVNCDIYTARPLKLITLSNISCPFLLKHA